MPVLIPSRGRKGNGSSDLRYEGIVAICGNQELAAKAAQSIAKALDDSVADMMPDDGGPSLMVSMSTHEYGSDDDYAIEIRIALCEDFRK